MSILIQIKYRQDSPQPFNAIKVIAGPLYCEFICDHNFSNCSFTSLFGGLSCYFSCKSEQSQKIGVGAFCRGAKVLTFITQIE